MTKNVTLASLANGVASPGSILAYGSATTPSGYLPCDGSVYSQSSYAALYAVLGTQPSFQGTASPTYLTYGNILSYTNSVLFAGQYYSTNSGATWAAVGSGSRNTSSYVWTGTYYLNGALDTNGVTYRTTPNGAGTTITTNVAYYARGPVWTGTRAIATGPIGQLSYSTTGTTWTAGTVLPGTSPVANDIAFGSGVAVIVGNTTGSVGAIWTTTDGATGTARTLPSGFGTASTVIAVSYVNSLFVAVDNAGAIASSPDGVTWTLKAPANTISLYKMGPFFYSVPTFNSSYASRVSYCGGYYFLSSFYSTDLISWKLLPPMTAFGSYATSYSVANAATAVYPTGACLSDGTRVYYTGDSFGCVIEPGCIVTPFNYTTGTQFLVPKIADLQNPNVYYYIKT